MKRLKYFLIFIFVFGFIISNGQILFENFENLEPEIYNCDDPGMAIYDGAIDGWTSYNKYPTLMNTDCDEEYSFICLYENIDFESYSGTNAVALSASNGHVNHINGDCTQGGMRRLGRGICFSSEGEPNSFYFGRYQKYMVSFKAKNAARNGNHETYLKVGYTTVGNEIPNNHDDDIYEFNYINLYSNYGFGGKVAISEETWKDYKAYIINSSEDNAYQLVMAIGTNEASYDVDVPLYFIDDIEVKCTDEIYLKVKELIENKIENCMVDQTYRVGSMYNCQIDFENLQYWVRVFDNQGNKIDEFLNTGEYFTIEESVFNDFPLRIEVETVDNENDYQFAKWWGDGIDDFYYWDEVFIETPQGYEGNDVIINNGENITWQDEDKIIVKDIIVQTGGKLTIKNKVFLSPNSHIIVEKGAKLVLDGGTLTSCDEWQGIIVKGNSTAEQPDPNGMPGPNQAGIVITKNNSIIENAHIGISTNYYGQWTDEDWGGLVQCTNTDFIGCWKAVEFMSYELENQSFLKNCRIGGGDNYTKEGVTIWNCNGILFDNCYMHNLDKGILCIDADYRVWHENTFEDCEYGIISSASSNGVANIDVRDNNHFNNNEWGIVISGNTAGNSGDIYGNYFEGCWKPVEVDGDELYKIKNNNFTESGYDVLVHSSNDHPSFIMCNDMVYQGVGIVFSKKNENSYFKSNDFVGSSAYFNGSDVLGLNANIASDIGTDYSSAKNLFSGVTNEIDWDDSNDEFNYHILKNNPPPRTIPHSELDKHNYEVKDDVDNDDDDDCNTVDPPTVTKLDVKIAINDYCYWLEQYRKHPKNPYYRWMFRKAKVKLMTKYYYWLNQDGEEHSWKEVEDILKRLCDDRWKITLYGHYMKYRLFSKADSLLNVLEDPNKREAQIVPEDLSDESRESFVRVQRINLKYQTSHGAYQLTSDELATLQEEAKKPIPESAYAKGLYLLTTGIYIPREWPDRISGNLQYREKKTKTSKEIWSIYPNPADSELRIAYNGKEDIEGNVIIYDLYGSKVMEKSVSITQGSDVFLNVSSLKSGVYILTVKDAENKIVKTQKLMKSSIK